MAEAAYSFKGSLQNVSGPKAGGDFLVQIEVKGVDMDKLKTLPTLTQDRQLSVLMKTVFDPSDHMIDLGFHGGFKGMIKRKVKGEKGQVMKHFLSFSIPSIFVGELEPLWTVTTEMVFDIAVLIGDEVIEEIRQKKKNRLAKIYAQMREVAELKDVSVDTIKGKLKDELSLDSFAHIDEDGRVALEKQLRDTINKLKKND